MVDADFSVMCLMAAASVRDGQLRVTLVQRRRDYAKFPESAPPTPRRVVRSSPVAKPASQQ